MRPGFVRVNNLLYAKFACCPRIFIEKKNNRVERIMVIEQKGTMLLNECPECSQRYYERE